MEGFGERQDRQDQRRRDDDPFHGLSGCERRLLQAQMLRHTDAGAWSTILGASGTSSSFTRWLDRALS